jgi:Ca2+-transporting ATPase
LIEGSDITVDESEITGESVEVRKAVPITYNRNEGKDPFLVCPSKVMSGMGLMVVAAVGVNTYYGNLKMKIQQELEISPLQVKINELSDEIGDVGVYAAFFTFSAIIIHYLYHCFLE